MSFGFKDFTTLVLLIVMGSFYIFNQDKQPETALAVPVAVIDTYKDLVLEARSVFVYDIADQKILFEKNAETPLALASLTKLAALAAVADIVPPDTLVIISAENLKYEGDQGLYKNEKWRLKNLVDFTLVTSSNDGISAIVDAARNSIGETIAGENAFVQVMNQKVKEIGLSSMVFLNETGLDSSMGYQNGGYGSAKDVVSLVNWMMLNKPQFLEATAYDKLTIVSESNRVHEIKNTNEAISRIPGVIASKTGFTEVAGGNLVFIFDVDFSRPIAVAILGSSFDGRFSDAEMIVNATLDYLEMNTQKLPTS